jgi:hypothetical protein
MESGTGQMMERQDESGLPGLLSSPVDASRRSRADQQRDTRLDPEGLQKVGGVRLELGRDKDNPQMDSWSCHLRTQVPGPGRHGPVHPKPLDKPRPRRAQNACAQATHPLPVGKR